MSYLRILFRYVHSKLHELSDTLFLADIQLPPLLRIILPVTVPPDKGIYACVCEAGVKVEGLLVISLQLYEGFELALAQEYTSLAGRELDRRESLPAQAVFAAVPRGLHVFVSVNLAPDGTSEFTV